MYGFSCILRHPHAKNPESTLKYFSIEVNTKMSHSLVLDLDGPVKVGPCCSEMCCLKRNERKDIQVSISSELKWSCNRVCILGNACYK